MPVHAHISVIYDPAVAALDGIELDEDDCDAGRADKVDKGDNMDSAVVDTKEGIVLPGVQNCSARLHIVISPILAFLTALRQLLPNFCPTA